MEQVQVELFEYPPSCTRPLLSARQFSYCPQSAGLRALGRAHARPRQWQCRISCCGPPGLCPTPRTIRSVRQLAPGRKSAGSENVQYPSHHPTSTTERRGCASGNGPLAALANFCPGRASRPDHYKAAHSGRELRVTRRVARDEEEPDDLEKDQGTADWVQEPTGCTPGDLQLLAAPVVDGPHELEWSAMTDTVMRVVEDRPPAASSPPPLRLLLQPDVFALPSRRPSALGYLRGRLPTDRLGHRPRRAERMGGPGLGRPLGRRRAQLGNERYCVQRRSPAGPLLNSRPVPPVHAGTPW